MAKYYRYNFPRGFSCTLEIRQNKENASQCNLYASGKIIGSYDSPDEASAAVLSRNTGYRVIDQLKDNPIHPASLEEWEVIEE